MVAGLDALCELDLLRGGEQRHLADVLEEELERVGRDLGFDLPLLLALLRGAVDGDDFDLRVLEGRVELVQLCGVEVELVESEGDLLGVELAGEPAGIEQRARLCQIEDTLDGDSRRAPHISCAQNRPLSSRAS